MIAAPQHEVKPAAAVIADDVICQSFIQSSSTLAYACLLIRRGSFELAGHVLHSLESKQASRFKDMVFYLQAQIGIETGEYAMVKKRLVPRVHRHPNDMVALSLLEDCIYREYAASPDAGAAPVQSIPSAPAGAPFGNAEAASAAAMASAFEATALPNPETAQPDPAQGPSAAAVRPAVAPSAAAAHAQPRVAPTAASAGDGYPTLRDGVPTVSPASPSPGAQPGPSAAPRPGPVEIPLADALSHAAPARPAAHPGREASAGHRAAASGEAELGLYQGISQDPNTLALSLWNGQGRLRSFCRAPDLEPLVSSLPRDLPATLQGACSALESGPLHKICLSFQHLTVTTFHAGPDGMGLITGPLNQSLLAIVRAENTFKKAAGGGPASGGGPAAPNAPSFPSGSPA